MSKNNNLVCTAVLVYRNGRLCDKSVYFLGEDDDDIINSFILQYYSDNPDIPSEVVTEYP